MYNISFPVLCDSCSKTIYGLVKYCPYCGIASKLYPETKKTVAAKLEIYDKSGGNAGKEKKRAFFLDNVEDSAAKQNQYIYDVNKKPVREASGSDLKEPIFKEESTDKPFPVNSGEVKQEEVGWEKITGEKNLDESGSEVSSTIKAGKTPLSADETRADIENEKPQVSKPDLKVNEPAAKSAFTAKSKWIAIAAIIIIAVLSGYLYFRPKDYGRPVTENKEITKQVARVVALDALRAGTDLSVTFSKLPKVESVLESAKKLVEISPRYQDQVDSAQKTVTSAYAKRDKQLLTYISKMLELKRYKEEQVVYALDLIQNGDITEREKLVARLIKNETNQLFKKGKVDSAKILAEFKDTFNDYAD